MLVTRKTITNQTNKGLLLFRDEEKRSFAGWWIFLILMIVIGAGVLGAFGAFGKIFQTNVERTVFESSYQRSEGLKSAEGRYRAQLKQIQFRLNTETDPEIINGLKSQEAMLNAQLDEIQFKK